VSAFFLTAGIIFVAELGDKSQLLTLWFATRYRWWVVMAAVALATLLLHLVAVAVGALFGELLPERATLVVAGLAFIAFGAWSLRPEGHDDDEGEEAARGRRLAALGPFGIVTAAFFVSEFGDKTQLAAVSLASGRNVIAVWLGATAGMVAANGLAVALGKLAGKRLPADTIRYIAAALFFAIGALALLQAALDVNWLL
jgi:putative Ca2+/H+ antiporter (TMEM165/GDT1 family)